MMDSTKELSFLFILLGVSAIFYATLIFLIENQAENYQMINILNKLKKLILDKTFCTEIILYVF